MLEPVCKLLTFPFRALWQPIAWFLRLLGFGVGVKRHGWQPPTTDTQHPMWAVVLERRENPADEPAVRIRNSRDARRAARARARTPRARARGNRVGLGRLSGLGSTSGKVVVPIAAVLALSIATVGAFAFFTATGSGSGTATTGALLAPSNPSASNSGSTVTVSWGAALLNGGGGPAQSYTVERYDGGGNDLGAACNGATVPRGSGTPDGSGSFSCTDAVPVGGTYQYKITALYNSWTATSSFTNTTSVAFGPASKIVLSGSTVNLASGVSRSYTATIEDAGGNPVTSGADSTDPIAFPRPDREAWPASQAEAPPSPVRPQCQ